MTEKEALSKAMAYCAARECSISQMHSKLVQWGVDREVSEQIISSLIQENFINEKRYAMTFASDKFRFLNWGRQKIAFALKQKGIPSGLINEAINSIDQEEYVKRLEKFISSKRKTLKGGTEYQNNIKLIRSAVNRGFEISLIREIVPLVEE
ncbi:MAG TPA: regulatory protein RecX [Bacteroidaceae bacterium]|nr:regulatory protein RecX [Bacteroidaceae bacterium]